MKSSLPAPGSDISRLNSQLALGGSTIADIAEKTAPAVVNIDTSTSITIPDSPFHFGHPFGGFQFFFGPGMEQFEESPAPKKFQSHGSGSGVIIRSDGYIL
ncbi:MAG: hypothetical protein HY711_07405, partial [Candidatus Melainabacteria bacterium]|nr:hypothetical protein [Candidatus Melainabacteria bacterium]